MLDVKAAERDETLNGAWRHHYDRGRTDERADVVRHLGYYGYRAAAASIESGAHVTGRLS